MNLRKQIFTTFLLVAILPLLIVSIYMLGTNVGLAFELYNQNLRNSTEIQIDLVEEHINRLIVRSGKFASSRAVRATYQTHMENYTNSSELSNEILKFTDETLDSVAIFALVTKEREILYSSGSNSDTKNLKSELINLKLKDVQYTSELYLGGQSNNLFIYTPVKLNDEIVGGFVVVYKTDFFLKMISSHKQLELSNSLIYCKEHSIYVTSKLDVFGDLKNLEKVINDESGRGFCKIGKENSLVYYSNISKTPWVLVYSIPISKIFTVVFDYGLISVLVLLLFVLIILFLSQKESKKILEPLEHLLDAVEKFFVSGAGKFEMSKTDPKTEIGYLASKFAGMSEEITVGQSKLKESNFLYNTLLKATYEIRIVIDLENNKLSCSLDSLDRQLNQRSSYSASEQLISFLSEKITDNDSDLYENIRCIVYGQLTEPTEIEVCCNMGEKREDCWYRIIYVPIIKNSTQVHRVVLHFEDITKKKIEELKLIRSSQTDSLCGLFNKSAFFDHCKMSNNGHSDAVFFVDLDQFKLINDNFGHATGDEILIATSHIMQSQFRNLDVLGRYGGDEFVIFSPGTSRQKAQMIADLLVKTLIFEKETSKGNIIKVTASVGVYMSDGQKDIEQAVKIADEAMYNAKQNGKSQYYILP